MMNSGPWPIVGDLLNIAIIVTLVGFLVAVTAWFLYLTYSAYRAIMRDIRLRRHDKGKFRHEVQCPKCGATIRARMADR